MLEKPALSSNLPMGRPTHGPPNPNSAHMEVDSRSTFAVPLHASAGIKRKASDTQLTDQQPVKAARTDSEPQTAHLHRQGHAIDSRPELQDKAGAQAAVSHAMSQAMPVLRAFEGHSHSAVAPQRSAQKQVTQTADVSIKQQVSQQQSPSWSPMGQSAAKAPLTAHVHGAVAPIKPEREPSPMDQLIAKQDATSTAAPTTAGAVPEAATAAALPKEVITASQQDSISVGGSPPLDATKPPPQASTVKSELQLAPSNQFAWQVGNDAASALNNPADTGSVMIKADLAADCMGEIKDMQRTTQVKLEPGSVPFGQQGMHETSLASGLNRAALASSCAAPAEGQSAQHKAPAGELVAPGSKVLDAKLQTSSDAFSSSASPAHCISGPTLPGPNHSGTATPMSKFNCPAAPSAVQTTQAVSPFTAVPTGMGSIYLGPAAVCTVKDRGHTHVQTAEATRPSSMLHTPDVSALLAKRRQELLVHVAAASSSPAECVQSCTEEGKEALMADS